METSGETAWMYQAAVATLLTVTGLMLHFAIEAVRWRLEHRVLLVSAAVPLTLASCVCLWEMLAYPQVLRSPFWRGPWPTGFSPEWQCDYSNMRERICFRPKTVVGGATGDVPHAAPASNKVFGN